MDQIIRTSLCACGRVQRQAIGAPIWSAICYCDDCHFGGRQVEERPNATRVRATDGGTPYLTYRDDRFSCVKGADLLVGHKITDHAPTQRFVASCCNSGVFLKFGPGHWVSAYRARFEGDLPPIEMRIQTKYRHADTAIPHDAPSYRRFPMKLFMKLIGSRFAMLIGDNLDSLKGDLLARLKRGWNFRSWPDPEVPTAGPAGPLTEVDLPFRRSELHGSF